ncbi:MAG: LLM class flavin-dependent oxidoreductase [Alicyclobacillus sp.]|nr:LLM class flavin-dependent oxidoreductase [Alicyclobacillus sp.]
MLRETPLSVLDLVPIAQGSTAAEAFARSRALAQRAEALGFHRYWVAEHHNMAGIASSATAVVIGYLAAHTSTIRVGSGGVMLPNHAPLVIAEQFGTLESMYPGRIDLGIGRAPGTDQVTVRAIRTDPLQSAEAFPERLAELRSYLGLASDGQFIRAVPGHGLQIPIWLLGSSDFSAHLAGRLGLPFAFAGQFAAENLAIALDTYRSSFQPSAELDRPYAMVGVNVIAADSDERARYLSTTAQQKFLHLIRGDANRSQAMPPVERMDGLWSERERAAVEARLQASIIGGPETVRAGLQAFLDQTGADELMVHTDVYHPEDRIRSYELVAQVWRA